MARRVAMGCRDCRKCMNPGIVNAGRNTVKAYLAIATCGLSLLVMSFYRKCRVCDHQLSLHGER